MLFKKWVVDPPLLISDDKTNSFKTKYDMNVATNIAMLLSYINTQLRDFYDSYEDLCKSLDLDQNEVKQKLSMIGYEYDESLNQFK